MSIFYNNKNLTVPSSIMFMELKFKMMAELKKLAIKFLTFQGIQFQVINLSQPTEQWAQPLWMDLGLIVPGSGGLMESGFNQAPKIKSLLIVQLGLLLLKYNKRGIQHKIWVNCNLKRIFKKDLNPCEGCKLCIEIRETRNI